MSETPDLEARVAALQTRVGELTVKVDANRSAINALGEQTRARFDALEYKVNALEHKVDDGFIEMRGKFDVMAAGQERIVAMLDTLIERDGDE